MSEFKYLECFLDKSGTDEAKCLRKVASERRVGGDIDSLVNSRVCSLSVLVFYMRHCSHLFLCMVVRQ